MDDVHNLREDAQRYLVEALKMVADAWVAEHPRPPEPPEEPEEPDGDEEDYDELYAAFKEANAAFDEADIALENWRDAHPWVDIDDLVDNYDPPRPNNLAVIRNELRAENPHPTNRDAKEQLIHDAAYRVNAQNGGHQRHDAGDWSYYSVEEVVIEEDKDSFRLVEGVDVDALKLGDEPLLRKRVCVRGYRRA